MQGGNCVADRPESHFPSCWPFQIIQNFLESSRSGVFFIFNKTCRSSLHAFNVLYLFLNMRVPCITSAYSSCGLTKARQACSFTFSDLQLARVLCVWCIGIQPRFGGKSHSHLNFFASATSAFSKFAYFVHEKEKIIQKSGLLPRYDNFGTVIKQRGFPSRNVPSQVSVHHAKN